MEVDFDFTQLPCAGIECFRLPVAERKACEQRQHPCHAGKYLCRCCPGCSAACGKLAATEKEVLKHGS